MDTYSTLRAFADSWFLLVMVAFFLGVCLFAFWPGLRQDREAAAAIPLRDEPPTCARNCPGCACSINFDIPEGLTHDETAR